MSVESLVIYVEHDYVANRAVTTGEGYEELSPPKIQLPPSKIIFSQKCYYTYTGELAKKYTCHLHPDPPTPQLCQNLLLCSPPP